MHLKPCCSPQQVCYHCYRSTALTALEPSWDQDALFFLKEIHLRWVKHHQLTFWVRDLHSGMVWSKLVQHLQAAYYRTAWLSKLGTRCLWHWILALSTAKLELQVCLHDGVPTPVTLSCLLPAAWPFLCRLTCCRVSESINIETTHAVRRLAVLQQGQFCRSVLAYSDQDLEAVYILHPQQQHTTRYNNHLTVWALIQSGEVLGARTIATTVISTDICVAVQSLHGRQMCSSALPQVTDEGCVV